MEVRYSAHLLVRLRMRGIPEHLPRFVYERARHRFFDRESQLAVAVSPAKLFGARRLVAVVYSQSDDEVLLVTIHPLKAGQLKNRIESGRWRELPLSV